MTILMLMVLLCCLPGGIQVNLIILSLLAAAYVLVAIHEYVIKPIRRSAVIRRRNRWRRRCGLPKLSKERVWYFWWRRDNSLNRYCEVMDHKARKNGTLPREETFMNLIREGKVNLYDD